MLKSVLDVPPLPTSAPSTAQSCRPHFLSPSLPSILQAFSTVMPSAFSIPTSSVNIPNELEEPMTKRARREEEQWNGESEDDSSSPVMSEKETTRQLVNGKEIKQEEVGLSRKQLETLRPVAIVHSSTAPPPIVSHPHLGPLTLDVSSQPSSTLPSAANTFDESLCSTSLPSSDGSSSSVSSNPANSLSPLPVAQLRLPGQPELISQDSKFESFAEFEEKFEAWKRQHLHPFRVASSEALREPDGCISEKFKYRYVVYHCAHYGEPRMRGIGKRPNQNYLPSGCKAMLRLNYSFNEKCLKVTTINSVHNNHEVSVDMFQRVSQKIRRSIKSEVGTPSPSSRRSRGAVDISSSSASTPLSSRAANLSSTSPLSAFPQPSPTPAFSQTNLNAAAPSPHVAAFAALMHQQQQNLQMLMYMNQQKENMQSLAMRGQLAQFQQPLLGLPQLCDSRQRSASNVKEDKEDGEDVDVINPPSHLPAPVPIKPSAISAAVDASSFLVSSPSVSPSPVLIETYIAQLRYHITDPAVSVQTKNDRFKQIQDLLCKWNAKQ